MKKQDFGLIIDELENVLDTLFLVDKYEVLEHTIEEKEILPEPKKEITKEKNRSNNVEPKQREEKKLYVKRNSVTSKRSKMKVDYISSPKKPTLQHYREWEKAFKPLKTIKIDKRRVELDIDETVEWIAQTDIFQLIYKEKLKKSFDLTLVIDRHHSMDIFDSLILEFNNMLEHYGVFEKVNFFYIDGTEKEAVFYGDKSLKQKIKSSSISNNNQNLILIISSCISPAWRSNSMYRQINSWSKRNFCSIVQMLPSNMWLLSTLQRGKKLNWKSTKEYPDNSSLLSKKEFFYFDENTEVLKIPILSLDHFSFKAWSSVVMGNSKYAISGIGFDVEKIQINNEVTKVNLSSKERLENFISQASSTAKRLSAYLANNHVSFEIARIIQDLKLKESSTAHLSEVFLGGIIERIEHDGQVSYDFYDGIRDVLKHHIAPSEALELFNKTSKFVSEHFDSAQRFPSLIQNPNSLREIDWDENMIAFAKIGIDILKRKGGVDYSKALALESEILGLEDELIEVKIPTTKRFTMGSEDGGDREKPAHEVIINYDFEMAQTPVTVGEFRVFVEEENYVTEAEKGDGAGVWTGEKWEYQKDASWKNPYFEQTDENPVVCVSWNDAQAYITWLNEKTNELYRLPTETEWEFACRAGTISKWHFGDDEKELDKYAWYDKNSFDLGKEHKNFGTNPVGKKLPNQWGLFDMHGNVWEWCLDDFEDNYNNTPTDGSEHLIDKKEYKSLRGGSWLNYAFDTRSADRSWDSPTDRDVIVGFRLLRTLP